MDLSPWAQFPGCTCKYADYPMVGMAEHVFYSIEPLVQQYSGCGVKGPLAEHFKHTLSYGPLVQQYSGCLAIYLMVSMIN